VVGLTDSSGNLVGNERYVYDPYGNITSTPSSTPMQLNPWRFVSGYQDGTSGFTKFGIRYDDTSHGRWTQHTPIGGSLAETIKANPYVCTQDDPVNEVDHSGASASQVSAGIAATLGLIAAGCGLIAWGIVAGVITAPAAAPFVACAAIAGFAAAYFGFVSWIQSLAGY
jgi:RHS repeat-associated protein